MPELFGLLAWNWAGIVVISSIVALALAGHVVYSPCSKHKTLGHPWTLTPLKSQMLKVLLLLLAFVCCCNNTPGPNSICFPGKPKTVFFPVSKESVSWQSKFYSSYQECRNGGVLAFLACLLFRVRNNGTPHLLREPIVQAAGSIVLSRSLLACLCGLVFFFGSALCSFFLATFQHVTSFSPCLSVKVLSFLGKASQNVFPSWAFPPRKIPRSWRNYLCGFFPSLEVTQSPEQNVV